MAFWFFPWSYERKGFEIQALWKFARELAKNSISEETFKTAFKSKGAGFTYLTTICHIVHPDKYLPTDGRTSLYLEKRDTKFKNKIDEMRRHDSPYIAYQSFLKEVGELFPNKTCADISLSAYLEDINDKTKESQIDTDAKINYWVVGATWGDIDNKIDKSAEFIESGEWVNGFAADSGNKSINLVKKVKAGDRIAIKSAFVVEKTISTVRINAVGIVRSNLGDGRHLEVEWLHKGPAFDVIGASYMQAIHNVTDKTDQHLIFKNSFKTERKGLQVANKSPVEKVELQNVPKKIIF